MLRQEVKLTLQRDKDDEGVRLWIAVRGGEQQEFMWNHRSSASYAMRERFLFDQCKRVDDSRKSVEKLRDTLNKEKKPNERPFQTHFDFDNG